MEGMLRKITTLKSDMISLLNASPSSCRENKERERQEEAEEEGLFLSDFYPNNKDDSDRFKDRDLGGRGPGQRAKEAKCLGQLPLWATSLGGIKGQCESAIIRFNDISALKNLHSGKTELAAQTINPRQFFRDRFERFDSLLRKKNINFEMVSEGEFENVHVRADPRLLGKALESVFINAVDGTKEQSSIQVRMHDRSDLRILCEQNVKC
jgi:signal transduction histidine kinase